MTLVDLDHGAERRRSIGGEDLQHEVGGERKKDRRQRAEQDEIDGVLAEPFEDKGAEPAGADQRRDDGQPDRLHRDDAQPGEQHREGQRQLDPPEDLPSASAPCRAPRRRQRRRPGQSRRVLRTTGSSA